MNPLIWERRHQLMLGLSALLGAFGGLAFAYLLALVGAGARGGSDFQTFLRFHFVETGVPWMIAGAVAAALLAYILRLNSTP